MAVAAAAAAAAAADTAAVTSAGIAEAVLTAKFHLRPIGRRVERLVIRFPTITEQRFYRPVTGRASSTNNYLIVRRTIRGKAFLPVCFKFYRHDRRCTNKTVKRRTTQETTAYSGSAMNYTAAIEELYKILR